MLGCIAATSVCTCFNEWVCRGCYQGQDYLCHLCFPRTAARRAHVRCVRLHLILLKPAAKKTRQSGAWISRVTSTAYSSKGFTYRLFCAFTDAVLLLLAVFSYMFTPRAFPYFFQICQLFLQFVFQCPAFRDATVEHLRKFGSILSTVSLHLEARGLPGPALQTLQYLRLLHSSAASRQVSVTPAPLTSI